MGYRTPGGVGAPMFEHCVSLSDVAAAANRIRGAVVRTPILFSERLERRLGVRVGLKAESLQHAGAFKARGATNAVLSLSRKERVRGVLTHSSGNHAAALARAASRCGVFCWIVMPENAPANKVANVRAHGVEPVFGGPTAAERIEVAERVQRETGAQMIHPYNDPLVIAGQGVVGLELLGQQPDVDAIVAPVGGGGLLSGVLTAVKALRPEVLVVAAEPQWADDTARSLRSGRIESPTRYDTIADGLRTPLGSNTFPIIRDLVDGVELVTERSIRDAVGWIAADAKLVSEPSGAVALAATAQLASQFRGKTVVAIVTGGNAEP